MSGQREATPEECQQAIAAVRSFEPVKVVSEAFAQSLRARCVQSRPEDGCAECTEAGTKNCTARCRPAQADQTKGYK